MTFRAQSPANLQPATEERDSTHGLFAPGYVFGVETLPIEDTPGEALLEMGPAGDDQPLWVSAPPENEPAPIASTVQTGADSKWSFWPSANGSVSIALPDGSDIRSLWVPVVPVQIGVSLSFAGGALMYPITTTGGEIVPIPKGSKLVTLSAIGGALKPDIWIYATHDIFTPNKTGINGAPLPLSGSLSAYDQLVMGTTGLKYYYPMNDPAASLAVADYMANHTNAVLQGGATLGGAALLNDNATSAQFDGGATTDIYSTAIPGTATGGVPWSLEFWFNYAGNGPGQNTAVGLLAAGAGTAGPMRVGILRANSNLAFGLFSRDYGVYIKPNTPHHLVVCVNAADNSIQYYLDGNLVKNSTDGNDAGTFDASHGVTIGGGNGMDGVVGNISKLAIYSRVLTAQEVATHWSNHL